MNNHGYQSKEVMMDHYYFCENFINKRYLEAEEFIDYIVKKYDSITRVRLRISYYRVNISSIYAHKMEVILNYKLACKNGDIKKIQKLQSEFDSIKNVKINNPTFNPQKAKFHMGTVKENELRENKIEIIQMAIKKYINGDSEEDIKKFLNIISPLYLYINTFLGSISNLEDYALFLIKNKNIKTFNLTEFNEIIQVLEFFIRNLGNNLSKLISYGQNIKKNESLIRSFLYKVEDNNFSLRKIYRIKLNRLNAMLKDYYQYYNYLLDIKSLLEGKSKNIPKSYSNMQFRHISEDFLIDYYTDLKGILKYYNNITNKNNINDDTKEELKKLYLSKLFEN